MSSRIHRGCQCIGIVLAARALLLAVFVVFQGERTVASLLIVVAKANEWEHDAVLSPSHALARRVPACTFPSLSVLC